MQCAYCGADTDGRFEAGGQPWCSFCRAGSAVRFEGQVDEALQLVKMEQEWRLQWSPQSEVDNPIRVSEKQNWADMLRLIEQELEFRSG